MKKSSRKLKEKLNKSWKSSRTIRGQKSGKISKNWLY
jgi:hypothetical protein